MVASVSMKLEWELPLTHIEEVKIHFGRALVVLDRDAARLNALGQRPPEDLREGPFKHIFVCDDMDVLAALKSMLDWYVMAGTTLS